MTAILHAFQRLAEAFTKQDRQRRISVPLIMQAHATECGAACLCSVLAYFDHWVPLTELRDRCEVSRDGSTAAGILRAARHYGLKCTGHTGDTELLKAMQLPLILFWEFNHFVILEGYNRKHFFLLDPAVGRRIISAAEFSKSYTGVALQFRATSRFMRSRTRRKGLGQYLSLWFKGSTGAVVFAAMCGLLLAVFSLVVPAALALYIDWVLGKNTAWGPPIAGLAALTGAAIYIVTWLKLRCQQRLAIRIAIIVSNRCVSTLLRLPIHFFNHRFAGDLTSRVLSIDQIATGLLGDELLGTLIDAVTVLAVLLVLVVVQPILFLIIMVPAVLHSVLVALITRMQTDANYALGRELGLLLGTTTMMLGSAVNLQMTSMDDQLYGRWAGLQARGLAAHQRLREWRYLTNALPDFFTITSYCLVLAYCASQVVAGEMTIGSLAGFFVLAAMLSPVSRFASLLGGLQTGQASLMRLDDILGNSKGTAVESGTGAAEAKLLPTAGRGKWQLTGHVELRGVTFGYNRSRPPLISDFNLVIRPGQRVAIVGPSGSGKSTLSHLVAGLDQPWSGEILFDGVPRREIPNEVLLRSLGMVDQHITMFSGTIRDNITLWSPTIPDEIVVAAARDACIHEDILMRPLAYEAQVAEGGSNFSGGQRQRLEIARTLAGNPTVLVLDEATSALDATTEKDVDNALRRRGMSCLIVAHRLSTIRDCDEIIVLNQGKEVQRGIHDQLMKDPEGIYAQLFRAG